MTELEKIESKLENIEPKGKLTTGQISGLARLSYGSLYRYVKLFPESFSPGVQQHKRGRRWSDSDLLVVLSIRALLHEHTPAAEIREKLAEGWRLDNDSALAREERSNLVKALVAIVDETNRIMRETEAEVRAAKFARILTQDDHHQVAKNEQLIKELWVRLDEIELHFRMKTEIDKRVERRIKPRWWQR